MANEFKIKKGLIVEGASGGVVVNVLGSQGQLLSVTDNLSGSIFAVSDISGVPIFDVNSSGLSTFDGLVSGITPVNAANFVTKAYVDGSGGGTGFLPVNNPTFTGILTGPNVAITGGKLNITSDGSAANGAEIYLKHANNNTTDTIGTLFFGNNADDSLSTIVVETNGASNTSNLVFRTSNAGTLATALTLNADNSASFTGTITANGGINGLTLANGGITGANFNITGVNQLTISDPGEGIVFTGTTTMSLAAIDDTTDSILKLTSATAFDLNSTAKIVNLVNPTVAQDAATKSYVDTEIGNIPSGLAFEGNWDARTSAEGGAGTPPSATPSNGQFWIVSVAGSQNLSGITDWEIGDWAIYVDNGAGTDAWQKVDNTSTLSGLGVAGQVTYWDGTANVAGDAGMTYAAATDTLTVGSITTTSYGDTSNWHQAYNKYVNSAAVTGTTTKTMTFTRRDGTTFTSSWADLDTDTAWAQVGPGSRTNYTLGFQQTAAQGGYAGFYFEKTAGTSDAGYFLLRGGADSGVYKQGGITLVGDGGTLTLATRTSASNVLRFMTGATSVERLNITGTGAFSFGNSVTNYGTSGQVITSNGNATPGWTTPTTGTVTGGGSNTYLAKWTTATNINSSAMFQAASGNFSIGITTPNAKLSVQNDISIGTSATDVLRLHNESGVGTIDGYSTRNIAFGSATNGEVMRIDNTNERVGIGTTGPQALLDVRKDIATIYDPLQDLGQRSGTATIHITNQDTTVGSFGQIMYDSDGSNQGIARIVFVDSGTASVDTAFVNEHNNTKAERMRITSNGFVGIGVTDPQAKLEVKGISTTPADGNEILSVTNTSGGSKLLLGVFENTYGWIQSAEGGIYRNLLLNPLGGNVGIGVTGPVGKFQVALPAYTNEDTNSQQAIFGVASGYGVRIGYNETDNKGYINVLKPGVAWGSLILQEDVGKVGIGTTSPQASLQIGGNVGTSSEKLDVRGNSSANYVASFEQDHVTGYGVLIDTDGTLVSEPALKIKNQGGNILYVGSNGDVGIGATSPGEKLEVSGGNILVKSSNNGGGATNNNLILFDTDTTASAGQGIGSVQFYGSDASGAGAGIKSEVKVFYANDGDSSIMTFSTSDSSTNNQERMRISSAGAIKFNAYGAGTLVTDSSGNITVSSGGGAGGPYLPLSAGSGFPLTGDLYLATASNEGNLFFGTASASYKIFGGGTYGYMGYDTGGYHRFLTSGSERFRIASDGKIQVGSDKVIWAGGYGGALVIRQNNATGDRLIKMVTVDSTGAIANDNVLVAKGANVGIGTTSPNGKLTILEVQAANKGDFDFQQIVYNGGWAQNVDGLAAIQWSDGIGSSNTIGRIGVTYTGSQGEFQIKDLYNGGYAGSGKVFAVRGDGRAYFTGNVGIGTTSPSTRLEVAASATTSVDIAHFSNSNDVVKIKHALDGLGSGRVSIFDASNNEDIRLSAQSNSWFNAGNVGIGTDNPLELLHLESTEPLIRFDDTNSGINYIIGQDGDGFKFTTNNSTYAKYTFDSNVGINSTAPTHKLDVDGVIRARQGQLIGANAFTDEAQTAFFTNGTADLNVDIVLPNASLWGYLEVDVTGFYNNQDAHGKLTKIYAMGLNVGGTIYNTESRISDAIGPVNANVNLGPIRWDSTTSTYRIRLAHIVSTGNNFSVKISAFTISGKALSLPNSWSLSSIYTESTAGLTQQYVYYNDRVGIGTSTPSALLDIQGTQGQLFSVTDDLSGSIFAVADISGVPILDVNSSGAITFGSYNGSNQTGTPTYILGTDASGNVVKTLSGGGTGGGFWQSSGNNIYNNNSGNVGVGTAYPDKQFSQEIIYYDTGTASQSGTTVTGVGTTFTQEMEGKKLIYADGTTTYITNFTNTTTITVGNTGTVASQAFGIYTPGVYMGRQSTTGNPPQLSIGGSGSGHHNLIIKGDISNGPNSIPSLQIARTQTGVIPGANEGLILSSSGSSHVFQTSDTKQLAFSVYDSNAASSAIAMYISGVTTPLVVINNTLVLQTVPLQTSTATKVLTYDNSSVKYVTPATLLSDAGGPYLPLVGGTLTGALTGTTGTFTGGMSTGYGVSFTNGATDFLLYNNANEDVLYMRDTTNGQMLTIWYEDQFRVQKTFRVDETSVFNDDVGIGETTLQRRLNLYDATDAWIRLYCGSSADWIFGANGSDHTFKWYNQSSNGGVGYKMELATSGALTLSGAIKGTQYNLSGNVANPTTTAATIYDQASVGLTLSAHNISFRNYDGANMVESVRFTASSTRITGKLGVGSTTTPGVPLDVTGSDVGSAFNDGIARFENTTSVSTGNATVINIRNSYLGANSTLIKFFRTSTSSSIANISFNTGGTAVNYNTGSDYRLKEDLKTFNGLDIIDNISVYNYKWKGVDFRGHGVLAHELASVFPDAVTGEKDAEEMQSVDYSKLVPVLIKSVQELKKEIEELKQQLNK